MSINLLFTNPSEPLVKMNMETWANLAEGGGGSGLSDVSSTNSNLITPSPVGGVQLITLSSNLSGLNSVNSASVVTSSLTSYNSINANKSLTVSGIVYPSVLGSNGQVLGVSGGQFSFFDVSGGNIYNSGNQITVDSSNNINLNVDISLNSIIVNDISSNYLSVSNDPVNSLDVVNLQYFNNNLIIPLSGNQINVDVDNTINLKTDIDVSSVNTSTMTVSGVVYPNIIGSDGQVLGVSSGVLSFIDVSGSGNLNYLSTYYDITNYVAGDLQNALNINSALYSTYGQPTTMYLSSGIDMSSNLDFTYTNMTVEGAVIPSNYSFYTGKNNGTALMGAISIIDNCNYMCFNNLVLGNTVCKSNLNGMIYFNNCCFSDGIAFSGNNSYIFNNCSFASIFLIPFVLPYLGTNISLVNCNLTNVDPSSLISVTSPDKLTLTNCYGYSTSIFQNGSNCIINGQNGVQEVLQGTNIVITGSSINPTVSVNPTLTVSDVITKSLTVSGIVYPNTIGSNGQVLGVSSGVLSYITQPPNTLNELTTYYNFTPYVSGGLQSAFNANSALQITYGQPTSIILGCGRDSSSNIDFTYTNMTVQGQVITSNYNYAGLQNNATNIMGHTNIDISCNNCCFNNIVFGDVSCNSTQFGTIYFNNCYFSNGIQFSGNNTYIFNNCSFLQVFSVPSYTGSSISLINCNLVTVSPLSVISTMPPQLLLINCYNVNSNVFKNNTNCTMTPSNTQRYTNLMAFTAGDVINMNIELVLTGDLVSVNFNTANFKPYGIYVPVDSASTSYEVFRSNFAVPSAFIPYYSQTIATTYGGIYNVGGTITLTGQQPITISIDSSGYLYIMQPYNTAWEFGNGYSFSCINLMNVSDATGYSGASISGSYSVSII